MMKKSWWWVFVVLVSIWKTESQDEGGGGGGGGEEGGGREDMYLLYVENKITNKVVDCYSQFDHLNGTTIKTTWPRIEPRQAKNQSIERGSLYPHIDCKVDETMIFSRDWPVMSSHRCFLVGGGPPSYSTTEECPTMIPTQAPSRLPTIAPTNSPVPTSRPSLSPTFVPTPQPTLFPTFVPTLYPTSAPVPNPTRSPTKTVTPRPTPPSCAPTINFTTDFPTFSPVPAPTSSPVPGPTPRPTFVPTPIPTRVPTPTPTRGPITHFTRSPTDADLNERIIGVRLCFLLKTTNETASEVLDTAINFTKSYLIDAQISGTYSILNDSDINASGKNSTVCIIIRADDSVAVAIAEALASDDYQEQLVTVTAGQVYLKESPEYVLGSSENHGEQKKFFEEPIFVGGVAGGLGLVLIVGGGLIVWYCYWQPRKLYERHLQLQKAHERAEVVISVKSHKAAPKVGVDPTTIAPEGELTSTSDWKKIMGNRTTL